MNLHDIQLLFHYNDWSTRQILAASKALNHEQLTTPTSHSFGSLRGTLVHMIDSMCAWRTLFQHQSLEAFGVLKEEQFPTLSAIEQRWNEESAAMRAYLAHLTDTDISEVIRYSPSEGVRRERVLWHCLFHVVNHGTQHCSEAAAILTEYGSSPGDLDFTAFLNQR